MKNCCSWSSRQPFATQITFSSSENLCPFMNSFNLGKNRIVTWSQDNVPDHTSAQALLPSKMPALNYSVAHSIRHPYSYCTANGWLEDQEQFFYNGIRTMEKCWTRKIFVAGEYVKNHKIRSAYLVFNCVGLRTL